MKIKRIPFGTLTLNLDTEYCPPMLYVLLENRYITSFRIMPDDFKALKELIETLLEIAKVEET